MDQVTTDDGKGRNGKGRPHNGLQGAIPGMSSRARKARSAITSGRALFVGGNPNSAWARRYADLVAGHVSDAGGIEMVSAGKLAIIKRAAAMECEIERLEAMLSRGEDVDLDAFGRAASHLRRLFEAIGIERRQKTVNAITLEGRYDYEDPPRHPQDD
jgi:hypothetical protein